MKSRRCVTARVAAALMSVSLLGCNLLGSGPGATVRRFYSSLDAGKLEDAMSLLDPALRSQLGDEKIRALLAKQSDQMRRAHQGIASIQVEEEEIHGETATVHLLIRFKDGTTQKAVEKPVLRDGKWKITASK